MNFFFRLYFLTTFDGRECWTSSRRFIFKLPNLLPNSRTWFHRNKVGGCSSVHIKRSSKMMVNCCSWIKIFSCHWFGVEAYDALLSFLPSPKTKNIFTFSNTFCFVFHTHLMGLTTHEQQNYDRAFFSIDISLIANSVQKCCK